MKIHWSKAQKDALNHMEVPFDFEKDMSDDELSNLYEILPDHLLFSANGEPVGDCLIVESIITVMIEPMKQRGLLA